MKLFHPILLYAVLAAPPLLTAAEPNHTDQPQEMEASIKKYEVSAKKLSLEQDDLSADVQDLIDEQTNPKVVKLLAEIEIVMGEATDNLEQANTDGSTIAIQTEVIEKIFEAAKKKKQQSGGESKDSEKSMDSMLEMMKNMMEGGKDVGKKPGQGKKPGEGEGDTPGGGGKGSGSGSGQTGNPDNTAENSERRVPKNSGNSGGSLPREFQKAMDAYNKGVKDSATNPQR